MSSTVPTKGECSSLEPPHNWLPPPPRGRIADLGFDIHAFDLPQHAGPHLRVTIVRHPIRGELKTFLHQHGIEPPAGHDGAILDGWVTCPDDATIPSIPLCPSALHKWWQVLNRAPS